MELAGLNLFIDVAVLDEYFATGDTVYGYYAALEPGAIGRMRDPVSRLTTIPEFSQIPDYSYGLADFILGNEHCFLKNAFFGVRNDASACHNYATRLGPLNSTHFPPQARAVYEGYHKLAIDTAVRCAQLSDAIDNMSMSVELPESASAGSQVRFPNEQFLHFEVVKRCELEALAIEAVAAHYSSDAWSMGHMWERWGAPVLAPSAGGQAQQFAAALQAGLIHGAREVLGKLPGMSPGAAFNVHDQMNAPGPWVPDASADDPANARGVRFQSGNGVLPGAGDGYLLECTSQRPIDDPDSSVAFYSESMFTSPRLQETKELMLACVARGFQEVYEAGPRSRGDLSPSPALHLGVQSSLSARCWNLRADNHSMWLGAGISSIPASRHPAFWAAVDAVGGTIAGALYQTLPLVGAGQSAKETAALYAELAVRAALFPDGTQSASMPPPFLGLGRNSLAVGTIRSGGVSQLDRFDRDTWSEAPIGLGGCDEDADCAPSEYCQRELHDDGSEIRSCVEKETGTLQAFRTAELQTWCEITPMEDLQRAATLCGTAIEEGGGNAECIACAELVVPHMRNACDEGSYDSEVTAHPVLHSDRAPYFDYRSMCDIAAPLLNAEPATVYAPYDPAGLDAALRAARSLCETGLVGADPIEYAFDDEPPPSEEAVDIDAIQLYEERNTCGASGKAHWFRFKHDPEIAELHQLVVTTSDLTDSNDETHTAELGELRFELFSGDDCDIPGPPASFIDPDKDGIPDAWAIRWETGPEKPNEVCVRVAPEEYDTWTSYVLSETTAEPGNALFTMIEQQTSANAQVSWPMYARGQEVQHQNGQFYKCDYFGWRRSSWDERWGEPNMLMEDWGPDCVPLGDTGFNAAAQATLMSEGSNGAGSATAQVVTMVSGGTVTMSASASGNGTVACDTDDTTYCSWNVSGTGRSQAELLVELEEDAEVEIHYNACGAYHSTASRGTSGVNIIQEIGSPIFLGNGDNPDLPCEDVLTRTFAKETRLEILINVQAEGATVLDNLEPDPDFLASRSRSGSITVTFRPLNP